MRTRLLGLAVAVSVLAACTTATAGPIELTVFGAASLKGAFDQIKPAFEAAHPGVTLTLSTDSSSALETQIEQGAPADVFLSADTANPQKLVDRGFAAGDPVVFARNELIVIAPADNPARVTSPADLARPGLRVIAAGDEVPITGYATQLVQNLGIEAAYAANVVSREDNVKAVVAKIELGEGDAGIVYVTDAAASTRVDSIAIPAGANVPASYAGVVVKGSPHDEAAQAFLDWFAGADGQQILSTSGFLSPTT